MKRLETNLGKIHLNNPILCASGCFGHAYEMAEYADLSKIGAVSIKTVTLEPKKGNPPPRIHEINSGIMSSIGLQNPGIDVYINDVVPKVQQVLRPDQIFFSIAGGCEEDYLQVAERVADTYDSTQIAAVEVNTACPNVKAGGGAIAKDAKLLYWIFSKIVEKSPVPVIGKISTDFDDFCESAKAVEAAGAQAIYMANTPMGMAIDIRTGRPIMARVKAPLNGPVAKPIGIAKTWDIYHAVKIPIIASGGASCVEDVIEYMMAGATAVGIGTMNFVEPDIAPRIVDKLERYAEEHNLNSISELTGLTARIMS